MWTSSIFGAKNKDFSKFMVCPHGQGGLSQCGHFADKGDQFFQLHYCNILMDNCDLTKWIRNFYRSEKMSMRASPSCAATHPGGCTKRLMSISNVGRLGGVVRLLTFQVMWKFILVASPVSQCVFLICPILTY